MKKIRPLRITTALALLAIAQGVTASESVRVFTPATPESAVINDRLRDLEQDRGESREDFLFSFPATRKLAVKIAVYRDGKIDIGASSLFHIYGVYDRNNNDNAGFFSLIRNFPQPTDKPRNGVTEVNWGVKMPGYFYGLRERTASTATDYRSSSDFAETAALRRGKVVMTTTNGKFRLSVWVQTVPRQKNEPRYGIKRFAISAPKKSESNR